MAKLYQGKYRVPTARLQRWDYSKEGVYYITICTKDKKNYFGSIEKKSPTTLESENTQMHLTEIGQIAIEEWKKTPILRPDMNLDLGEFVVMPNHFHAIIIIGENKFNTNADLKEIKKSSYKKNEFSLQTKNLASIIRGFKSSVTSYARKNKIEFDWQTRFHEHIVRSTTDLENISKYIINNPSEWASDEFNND